MTKKDIRDLCAEVRGLGVVIDEFGYTGKGHSKLSLAFRGKKKVFFAPSSPSDYRGRRNLIGEIRKWTRSLPAPEKAPEKARNGTVITIHPPVYVPDPPKKETIMEEKKKHNVLGQGQWFQVMTHIKEHGPEFNGIGVQEATDKLNKVLSFQVNKSNLQSQTRAIAEVTGVDIRSKVAGVRKDPSRSSVTREEFLCLAAATREIMVQLGMKESPFYQGLCELK